MVLKFEADPWPNFQVPDDRTFPVVADDTFVRKADDFIFEKSSDGLQELARASDNFTFARLYDDMLFYHIEQAFIFTRVS